MAQNPIEDAVKLARDALYVGLGLGVIAVQKAQVQRRELRQNLTTGLDERMRLMEARLAALEEQVDGALDQVEARLPDPVQDVSKQVRAVAKTARATARDQLQGLVGRPNGAS
jgi:outer membrane PBP1 activator LpoA protein